MSPSTVSVIVQDAAGRPDTPNEKEIRGWANAAVEAGRDGEITVRIVTEEESADLNRRYRGREGATNVLAFPGDADYPKLDDEPRPIGDIVVCADVLARECADLDGPVDAHWAHVVIHGTLHLMGYDHVEDRDAEVMEERERELLADFGFPDPYAAD